MKSFNVQASKQEAIKVVSPGNMVKKHGVIPIHLKFRCFQIFNILI